MEVDPKIVELQNRKYEIGIVQFLDSDIVSDQFIQTISNNYTPIGMCEAETLCIDNNSGELVLIEHEVENRIASKVAVDQGSFLKTIPVLEEHFDRCVEDDDYFNNDEEAKKVRIKCAQIAGGSIYEPFFCSLVGA